MKIVSVLIFFIHGLFFSTFLKKEKLSFLERIGLGFWVYSFLFTFLFFILHVYFHVAYTFSHGWILHVSFLVIFLLFFLWKFVKKEVSLPEWRGFSLGSGWPWWKYVMGGILGVSWVVPFVYGFLYPVPGWDSIVLYDFYGYVFAKEGNMLSTLRYSYFDAYPFYIHLSHMWLYLSGFSTPLFWHALLYISFVWVGIGWVLRQKYPPWMVWITAAVFTGIGSFYGHSMLGYNNLDASGFLALAFLYAYEWIRTKEYPYLLLSSILGGGYLWCRAGEPWWLSLLLFYAISLVIVKEMKWWKKGVLFVVCVIFLLTTKVVWEYSLQHWETLLQRQQASVALSENKENLPTKREEKAIAKEEFSLSTYGEQVVKIVGSVFTPLKYITLERVTRYLPLTIDMFWRAIVKPRLAYWWIVLLLMILFLSDGELRKRRELWTWPFFFWVNVAMIFVGTYVFIQTFPDWNIPGSAERMSMFLEPLVVFWSLPVITLCLEGRKA